MDEPPPSSCSSDPCICLAFRMNSGTSSSVSRSIGDFRLTQGACCSPLSPSVSFVGGTLGVLRNWLAQGAMCPSVSSFLCSFVSKSTRADWLPVRCLAFIIISDRSMPPPPVCLGGGAALPGFIVDDLIGFWGERPLTGRVWFL